MCHELRRFFCHTLCDGPTLGFTVLAAVVVWYGWIAHNPDYPAE